MPERPFSRPNSPSVRIVPRVVISRAASNEMFNRNAIGVRAHADGVGVKLANLACIPVRGIDWIA